MTNIHSKWRRFRPQQHDQRDQVVTHGHYTGVLSEAWRIVDSVTSNYDVRAHDGIDQLDRSIDSRKATAHSAAEWLALVLLQSPRAARAQAQMDAHKYNYHNKNERLYELIDFNDSFVNTVLALPKAELAGFAERLKSAINEFCRRVQAPCLDDEQYDAIVRGLSREIAVYRAALDLGYSARMTSRTEDAFGIDMVLEDLEGTIFNIDVKTPSAFRHRLGELEKEGRLSEDDFLRADEQDYFVHIHKHHGSHIELVPVVLLCIRPERFEDIINFEFISPQPLADLLHVIAREGRLHT